MFGCQLMFTFLACLLSLPLISCEEFWSDIFYFNASVQYYWSAEKINGQYAESSMGLFIFPILSPSDSDFEVAHEEFESLKNTSSIWIRAVSPTTTNSSIVVNCYQELHFDVAKWMTTFELVIPSTGYYAVFAEHDPEEFAINLHYLKDSNGVDIEPYSISSSEIISDTIEKSERRWAVTIGASVVVWLVTFVGLVFAALSLVNIESIKMDFYGKLFAAGALLGTAFCIIFLEASHYIESNTTLTEPEMHGHWAAMVLIGFVTPVVVDLICKFVYEYGSFAQSSPMAEGTLVEVSSKDSIIPSGDNNSGTEAAMEAAENGNAVEVADEITMLKTAQAESQKKQQRELYEEELRMRSRILSTVLVGDFFHNFCDGIFIGVAFQSCDITFGWTVTSITVFHEIIQELADYLVLTKVARISTFQALCWNAFCGISVVLGAIAITASNIDDYTVGMLLAFGAGQYLYIGAVELMPTLHGSHHSAMEHSFLSEENETNSSSHEPTVPDKKRISNKDKIVGLFLFILAVVATGLILLNHNHCEGGDANSGEATTSDAHSGHNH